MTASRVRKVQAAGNNVWHVNTVAVSCAVGADERVIIQFEQGHGQAGGKSGDSRELPAAKQLGSPPRQAIKRQFVGVAENEIVPEVEGG
ncbi:MAG: hypothetical protein ACLQT6_10270 [Desulfomonilaceae bacterium]